jgi:hypothetical protein
MAGLALKLRYFVFDSEFLALQLGYFGICRGGVGEAFLKFRLQGLMFRCEFTEMRLNAHQSLHCCDLLSLTQSWGLVEPPATA